MRILRLSLANLGPYVCPVGIDFTRLGLDGPFLLEGPTGAGKTTLIDAIVFALYGKVSGKESDDARLVSSFRDPMDAPWVELVVETSHGLYRVRRTPAYQRPSRRAAAGVATENATAKLWKLADLDDEGTAISNRIDEVAHELEAAIGLRREQFTQTVVLPQGDFASFLRATPEDRKGILTRVFGTQIYDGLVKQLDDAGRESARRMDAAVASWTASAAAFAALAWDGPQRDDDLETPWRHYTDAVAARDTAAADAAAAVRCAELSADRERAVDATMAAQAELDARREALVGVERDNALVTERGQLVAERDALSVRDPEVAQERTAVALAQRAERVRRPLLTSRRADEAVGQAHDAAADVIDVARAGGIDVAVALDDIDATEALVPVLTGRRLGIEQRRAEIAAWRDRAERLASKRVDIEAALRGADHDESALVAAMSAIDQATTETGALEAELERTRLRASSLESARAGEQAARRVRNQVVERDRLRGVRDRCVKHVDASVGRLAMAAAHHDELRTAWLTGLAGNLASDLRDGEPCPVCGSMEHPAPATTRAERASRDDVDAAAATEARLGQAVAEDRTALALAEQALAGAADDAGDETESTATAGWQAALEEVDACQQAVGRAAELSAALLDIRQQAARLGQRAEQLRQSCDRRRGEIAAMQSAADAEAAAIADQELAEGDLGERTVRVDAEAERLDALLDALRHYLASVRNAASAAAELGQVVADEGFADAATAAAALIPPEEASERAAAIADFDARMAAVTARLGTEAMARASELSRVDPTALGEAVRGAQSEAQRCRELLGAVSRAFQGASDAAVSLAEIAGEVDRQRAAHQPLARMRAVASGDNALSMTLPTYVLLERFDEVLELANQRLIAMTDGRYELERADDHEGRTHRQGLGLHMIDHEAGDVRRATRTLSGGETFVTSLALALGLSDAVTTAAGGIELGTLLVDEGFGSLDGENLDRVMTQFAALRSDGRQVGVISHVEELKSRIHDRITVRALGDGTSTLECPVPGVLFEVSR